MSNLHVFKEPVFLIQFFKIVMHANHQLSYCAKRPTLLVTDQSKAMLCSGGKEWCWLHVHWLLPNWNPCHVISRTAKPEEWTNKSCIGIQWTSLQSSLYVLSQYNVITCFFNNSNISIIKLIINKKCLLYKLILNKLLQIYNFTDFYQIIALITP